MKPPKTDNQETLYFLIKNRSLTSIELRRLTKSSYPPARCKNLEELGINIIHTSEKYVNRNKKVSHITRYTLGSRIVDAKKVYKQMTALNKNKEYFFQ